jgi:hypothetical protein
MYAYEVYTRDFVLSLTAPMSCRTGRHTTVLGGMRWCVMVPLNGSGFGELVNSFPASFDVCQMLIILPRSSNASSFLSLTSYLFRVCYPRRF